mgnify:CR=1 FL=1
MSRARDLADSADKDIAGTLTVDAVDVQGTVTADGLTVDGDVEVNGTGDANGAVLIVDDAGSLGVEIQSTSPPGE